MPRYFGVFQVNAKGHFISSNDNVTGARIHLHTHTLIHAVPYTH
jgi:hypothetical protein